MLSSINGKISRLLDAVSAIAEVVAIGRTGDIRADLLPGQSDVDIFVFCGNIPDREVRDAAYQTQRNSFTDRALSVCEGGDWGTGDVFKVDGVDIMLMYFRMDDTVAYINDVLAGNHTECIRGFYPVGRLATIKDIHIVYDRSGALSTLKGQLAIYPAVLKRAMINAHLGKTWDEEDLGRVVLRKDVLFYHQVLEVALDHYLQVLYAVNETFFPSRKRTREYIDSFKTKPDHCYERLAEVVRLGSSEETIAGSVARWRSLVDDLHAICGVSRT